MKIKFIGTRGEIEESSKRHKKQSSVLISYKNNYLLLDAGEGLNWNKDLPGIRPYIILTHAHPDHYEGLPKGISKIWLPKGKEWNDIIKKYEIEEPKFYKRLSTFKLGKFTVTSIPVVHSPLAPAVLLIIKAGKKKIIYAPDFAWLERKEHSKYLENADLWIGDGSTLDVPMIRKWKKDPKIKLGHSMIKNIISTAKKLNTKRIIFTHFGKWLVDNPKEGYKKLKELGVEYAFDSKVIELSALEAPDIEALKPRVFPKPEAKAGKILVPPHGTWILEGKKRAILSTIKFKKYIDEPVFLIQGNYALGVIRLEEPEVINNLKEFKDTMHIHRVSLEERKEWGKAEPSWLKFPLYMYPVKLIAAFKEPVPIKRPRGPQVWIEEVKLLKKLSLKELILLHATLHSTSIDCSCSNLHLEIVEELTNRGYPHLIPHYNILDRTIELIRDAEAIIKNPGIVKKLRDEIVRDDWRIIIAWSKLLKAGKKMMSPQFRDKTLQEQKQIVKQLYNIYKKEMIRRGWKAKAKIELILPAGMQIKDIDVPYVKKLKNEELIELHEWLHKEFKKIGKVTEDLYNADIFIMIEMLKRGLIDEGYEDKDELDKQTRFAWLEYGIPGLEEELIGEEITLEQVLNAFRTAGIIPVKGQPFASYLCGRVVNLGKIPKNHDLDLLFRQLPDPRIIIALKKIKPAWLARRIHPVFDPGGPVIGYSIPIHGYALNPLPRELQIKGFGMFRTKLTKELKVSRPVIGLKPKSGLGKHEWWDAKESWLEWGVDNIEPGIYIEEKVDGRRFQIHLDKAKGIAKLITEDRQRDRADALPELMNEIKKLPVKNAIFDGEIVVYELPGKIVAKTARTRREIGEPVPREDTASLTVGKVPDEIKNNLVLVFYDILYLNGKALNELPYKERRSTLIKLIPKNAKYLDYVRGEEAKTMKDYFRLVWKYRSLKGSEGIVMKRSDSIYPIKYTGENRTGAWAKIKNLKEIDVIVLGIVQKRTKEGKPLPTWMYQSYFSIPKELVKEWYPGDLKEYKGKIYARIGRAYGTGVKAKIGDIITVMPIRIREYKKNDKRRVTWMFPYFKEIKKEKKEPDTITTVMRLIKLGTGPVPTQKRIASLSDEDFEEWLTYRKEPVITIMLEDCPYWNYINVCPFRRRMWVARMPQYLTVYKMEKLRFPIGCPLGDYFKCHFVKDYYYIIETERLKV